MKNDTKKIAALPALILMIGFMLSGLPIANADAAEKKVKAQTICPVMGDPINKKYYVDYKGFRIYFCCRACPDMFKENPEKYMKILKDSGVTLEKSPKGNYEGTSQEQNRDRNKHHDIE